MWEAWRNIEFFVSSMNIAMSIVSYLMQGVKFTMNNLQSTRVTRVYHFSSSIWTSSYKILFLFVSYLQTNNQSWGNYVTEISTHQ